MKKFLGLLLSAVMLVSLFWISPVEAWAATEVTSLVINGEVPVPEEGGLLGIILLEQVTQFRLLQILIHL